MFSDLQEREKRESVGLMTHPVCRKEVYIREFTRAHPHGEGKREGIVSNIAALGERKSKYARDLDAPLPRHHRPLKEERKKRGKKGKTSRPEMLSTVEVLGIEGARSVLRRFSPFLIGRERKKGEEGRRRAFNQREGKGRRKKRITNRSPAFTKKKGERKRGQRLPSRAEGKKGKET